MIPRSQVYNSLFDSPFADLLVDPAAIVGELEPHRAAARGPLLPRGNGRSILLEPIVAVDDPPILNMEHEKHRNTSVK
jgi:hypothetical protein